MQDMHHIFTTKNGQFKCPVCGTSYATNEQLHAHFACNVEHKTAATLLLSIARTNIYHCSTCGRFGKYTEGRPVWDDLDGWIHQTCKEELAHANLADSKE